MANPESRQIAAGKPRKKPRGNRRPLPMVRQVVPKKYHHWVDKAENGSTKARVVLKCLDCTCWDRREITNCEITACSLHDIRQYQKKEKNHGAA